MKAALTLYQIAALKNPFQHFAFFAGISCGKSFTGAHFAIDHILAHPEKTGFIAANSYDQLVQASLREFLYWCDVYRLEVVADRAPPSHWNAKKRFAKYNNILSILHPNGTTVHVFKRVLSDPDALRGIEFSWYWLDESRDTPQIAHDVILSRLRESDYIKGLITTTTNGEDWTYKRFTKNTAKNFGSMHVATIESVKAGIISQDFYDTLRSTYSPLMAAQELDAQHVNVNGGRAYYAFSKANARSTSLWGATFIDLDSPIIIGMDFNFSPSPCVWVIGQLAPDGSSIHWFRELSESIAPNSRDMARRLAHQFPGTYMRIFGDASGNRGSTSNAGEYDYAQISEVLSEEGIHFSIDVDQANPRVKDRVEAMNATALNALGEIRQTYNPALCPLLDLDLNGVGWKQNTQKGMGKLDAAGDPLKTHASDAAGYAIFKLFPPGRRGTMGSNIESDRAKGLSGVF